MKKIGKFIANTLIVIYAIIAIAVTILLLSYNDYQVSVLGKYTFLLMKDDDLEEKGYPEGSLVLVKETKAKNINEGDYVFLYRDISSTQFKIEHAKVLMKDTSAGEYAVQYVLDGNVLVDHEDVIGSTKDIKVVPHMGTILSILQSRYGYLFLIVVVSFIAFLYEIYELIMEIKYGEREEYEEDDEDDEEDEYDEEEEVVVKPRKTATKKKEATTKKTSATAKTTSAAPRTTNTRKSTSTTRTTAKKATTSTATKTTATKTTAKKATTSTAPKTTAKTGTIKRTTKSK